MHRLLRYMCYNITLVVRKKMSNRFKQTVFCSTSSLLIFITSSPATELSVRLVTSSWVLVISTSAWSTYVSFPSRSVSFILNAECRFESIVHSNLILISYFELCIASFNDHTMYILQLTSNISPPQPQLIFHAVWAKLNSHSRTGVFVQPLC
jgi:hypothetical protein